MASSWAGLGEGAGLEEQPRATLLGVAGGGAATGHASLWAELGQVRGRGWRRSRLTVWGLGVCDPQGWARGWEIC